MRKSVVTESTPNAERDPNWSWLDLDQLASVQVTSEDPASPIESALSFEGPAGGWRANAPGEQTIRVLFDQPTSIHHIHLRFVESREERTQEFVLRWKPVSGEAREIVRQQWNFSPAGSTVEVEDYTVDLPNASVLELVIRPNINSLPGSAVATLDTLRVA
jgi:hypothetical protein